MVLVIAPRGDVRALYSERFDLACLGDVRIRRASQVDPDAKGRWWADLSLSKGPKLGPFACRRRALAAEQKWLVEKVLSTRSD